MDSNNTAHLTMAKAFFGTNHPLFNMFNISVGAVSDGHAEMTMPFSEQRLAAYLFFRHCGR